MCFLYSENTLMKGNGFSIFGDFLIWEMAVTFSFSLGLYFTN